MRVHDDSRTSPVARLGSLIAAGRRADAEVDSTSLVPDRLPDAEILAASRMALQLGECSQAIRLARAFARRSPKVMDRVLHAAGILAEAGRLEEALELVEPLARQHGGDPSINHFLGTVQQQLGAQDVVEAQLLKALAAAESSGITWLTLAAQHRFSADDPLFRRLAGLRPAFARLEPARRVPYLFALGKALLDTGDADGAFDAFAEGGSLNPESALYDAGHYRRRADSVITGNDAASVARVVLRKRDTRAIFVLGMPRSGTTLLQRILTANDAVAAGGEFAGMGVATMDIRRRGLETAAALSAAPADVGSAALDEVAAVYTHLLDERFGAPGRIVDKSISNTQFAALIALLFPAAPLILVERNALDVAWSCFRTYFSNGQGWSWTLENISRHLLAETRLAAHWKQVLGDRLIHVSYERLVREPEEVVPALCVRCGIDYDESMLAFHKRGKGAVQTASVAQVREPLNDRSIGAARAVAHRLGPVLDAFPAAVSGEPGA